MVCWEVCCSGFSFFMGVFLGFLVILVDVRVVWFLVLQKCEGIFKGEGWIFISLHPGASFLGGEFLGVHFHASCFSGPLLHGSFLPLWAPGFWDFIADF